MHWSPSTVAHLSHSGLEGERGKRKALTSSGHIYLFVLKLYLSHAKYYNFFLHKFYVSYFKGLSLPHITNKNISFSFIISLLKYYFFLDKLLGKYMNGKKLSSIV